jgi:hypothetical protein
VEDLAMMELALLLWIAASQSASAAVTRELEQIEQELAATWKARNCHAWIARVAPEWSVTHIDGTVLTRAQAQTMCRAQETPMDAFTIDEVVVRAHGDAAVSRPHSRDDGRCTSGDGEASLRTSSSGARAAGEAVASPPRRWRVTCARVRQKGDRC